MSRSAKQKDPIDLLTPSRFENLVFDLMVNMDMSNVKWRTPGADGGRDLEGMVSEVDFSGYQSITKWYVECKRYASAIDWPTIYGKISHAEAGGAHTLLICTQSKISPQAITRTEEWNAQRKSVLVRLWAGHDLALRLSAYPDLQIKYGLGLAVLKPGRSFVELSLAISKTLGSFYSRLELSHENADPMLVAAHALASLLHQRMCDIDSVGYIESSSSGRILSDQVVNKLTTGSRVDGYGLNALSSLLVALSKKRIYLSSVGDFKCRVAFEDGVDVASLLERYKVTLESICIWSDMEMEVSGNEVILSQRSVL